MKMDELNGLSHSVFLKALDHGACSLGIQCCLLADCRRLEAVAQVWTNNESCVFRWELREGDVGGRELPFVLCITLREDMDKNIH